MNVVYSFIVELLPHHISLYYSVIMTDDLMEAATYNTLQLT